jgi:hypothetical protein
VDVQFQRLRAVLLLYPASCGCASPIGRPARKNEAGSACIQQLSQDLVDNVAFPRGRNLIQRVDYEARRIADKHAGMGMTQKPARTNQRQGVRSAQMFQERGLADPCLTKDDERFITPDQLVVAQFDQRAIRVGIAQGAVDKWAFHSEWIALSKPTLQSRWGAVGGKVGRFPNEAEISPRCSESPLSAEPAGSLP